MKRTLISAVLAMLVFTVLLGLVYPLAVTGVAQVAFNHQANGSLERVDGRVVGSSLLAQDTSKHPGDFHARPSITGDSATATAFANRGPNQNVTMYLTRQHLRDYLALEGRYDRGLAAADVPIDAVTFSASGVDPHISPANARIQAHRVAAVRGLPLATVDRLVDEHTDGRFLGIFGEPGVNVTTLNLALDREVR